MNPAVKLADLTDALDMLPEEAGAWLDRQAGRVVVVENDLLAAAEEREGEALPEDLEDWQAEAWPVACGIADGNARYLALPDKFEFHEYRHIERFIGTVGDVRIAEQLWHAIKGHGAFRRFKDTAAHLGLIDDWHAFRDAALRQLMLEWAEQQGVTVDQK